MDIMAFHIKGDARAVPKSLLSLHVSLTPCLYKTAITVTLMFAPRKDGNEADWLLS